MTWQFSTVCEHWHSTPSKKETSGFHGAARRKKFGNETDTELPFILQSLNIEIYSFMKHNDCSLKVAGRKSNGATINPLLRSIPIGNGLALDFLYVLCVSVVSHD